MHADFVGSIRRLPLHPLNIFLARESLPAYKQHEVFSFDAFEEGAVVPRLRLTVVAVNFSNLSAIVVIGKRWRVNGHNIIDIDQCRVASSKQKSESTSEGNAQKESHQGDEQPKKPLFHVRTSLQLREQQG
jgi:hypothetical protein